MRYWAWLLILGWLVTLWGCGGHSADTSFLGNIAGVAGDWLETAPQLAGGAPETDGGWPIHALTLTAAGAFRYEDRSPANWAAGGFRAEGNTLIFTPAEAHGDVTFFTTTQIAYALAAPQLILTDEITGGTQSYQYARLLPQTPPLLVNEWLAVRRLSLENYELPLTESRRLLIGSDGKAEIHRYTSHPDMQQGTLLVTDSGHVGIRIPCVDTQPGRLRLFGQCRLYDSVMTLCAPDGVTTCYAQRVIANSGIIGAWSSTKGSLTLASDGTYRWQHGDTTETGTWRSYQGGYLCLMAESQQHTYAWTLFERGGLRTLLLGEWVAFGDTYQYRETTWSPAT